MSGIQRFWKAVADDYDAYEGSPPDYRWLAERIEDEDHPRYGPPIPMSMRPPIDRILREAYMPGLIAQINKSHTLLGMLHD